jgi:hypothetical protein
MKPRGEVSGGGPVVCATSGLLCWDVKAQFSGILEGFD